MAIGALPKIWYALSKTLAERAAWEFCNKNGIDLVTILPSFLVGPSLPPDLCSTASDVLGLLKGVFYSPLIELIRGCSTFVIVLVPEIKLKYRSMQSYLLL